MQYAIPSLAGDPTEDFVGGYSRIHQVETVLPGVATNCQMVDMTDQIGCLAQADPCSIGYAGDGANTWASRATYVSGCTSANPSACPATGMGPMRIHTFAPGTTTVQKLGTTGEYELSRKLYFASFLGFQNIGADPVSGLTTASSELALANWETTTGPAPSMTALLVTDDFFDFGTQTVGGTSGIPFCEDFNEDNVCNGGFGAAGALGKTNTNACTATGSAGTGINSAIPNIANTANTICGNGTVEAYEECDNGANNGTAVGKCSLTCRCTTAFVQTSTSGDNGCQ